MFSGLTNQFTSLVGAVKGGQGDEDVPAPTQDGAAAAPAVADSTAGILTSEQDDAAAAAAAASGGEQPLEGEEGAKSIAKSNSILDSFVAEATGWLGSAKGWLGSASIPSMPAMPSMPSMPSMPAMPAMPSIPSIPGLRKGGAEAEGEAGLADATGAGGGLGAGAVSGDDDDKSRYISATEGADSHPASGGGTPTGDEGQIGQGKGDEVKITTKVTQQAKHFGSFLSSAISKAGTKIKETVKDNTILESFNKEQEAFIKGQGGVGNGAAPWIGHPNEAKIKEEIMGLSQDRRNFVRAPPAGVDFEFSYDTAYPTAIAIMAEDKALETMRFELVPKIITEEHFWRNYFYRVSLIIQAAELGTLGADGVGQASSGEDAKNINKDNIVAEKTVSVTSVAASASAAAAIVNPTSPEAQTKVITTDLKGMKTIEDSSQVAGGKENPNVAAAGAVANASVATLGNKKPKLSESEFVSDDFQTTSELDLAEIKDGMRKLGIDSMIPNDDSPFNSSNDEEQWEKDLEAELKDYEVVVDNAKGGGSSSSGGGGAVGGAKKGKGHDDDNDEDDELPTISNLRTRSRNNDLEEFADLIEDTDDLK